MGCVLCVVCNVCGVLYMGEHQCLTQSVVMCLIYGCTMSTLCVLCALCVMCTLWECVPVCNSPMVLIVPVLAPPTGAVCIPQPADPLLRVAGGRRPNLPERGCVS